MAYWQQFHSAHNLGCQFYFALVCELLLRRAEYSYFVGNWFFCIKTRIPVYFVSSILQSFRGSLDSQPRAYYWIHEDTHAHASRKLINTILSPRKGIFWQCLQIKHCEWSLANRWNNGCQWRFILRFTHFFKASCLRFLETVFAYVWFYLGHDID